MREDDEKVALFVPTLLPFTFHWYDGAEPPLTGTAVNVIFPDSHKGRLPEETEIVTEASVVQTGME